jgi:hypothetical protein
MPFFGMEPGNCNSGLATEINDTSTSTMYNIIVYWVLLLTTTTTTIITITTTTTVVVEGLIPCNHE